jgi:hypothetical protein
MTHWGKYGISIIEKGLRSSMPQYYFSIMNAINNTLKTGYFDDAVSICYKV